MASILSFNGVCVIFQLSHPHIHIVTIAIDHRYKDECFYLMMAKLYSRSLWKASDKPQPRI